MLIEENDYRTYLNLIRNWDSQSIDDQIYLKQWYRNYYANNNEQERNRF